MPSTVRPAFTRFPRGSVVRCVKCGRTGTPGQISGHTASTKGPCRKAEIELVSLPPGADHVVQPIVQARVLPPPMTPPTIDVTAESMPQGDEPTGEEDLGGDDPDPGDEEEVDDADPAADLGDVPYGVPTSVPDRRRQARPGTAGDRPAPPPTYVEDAWKPGHLSPETHVYYRIARTDPRFAELFGSNYRGPSVYAFADEIVHAFFMLNLDRGLGLAELSGIGSDGYGEGDRDGRTANHADAA